LPLQEEQIARALDLVFTAPFIPLELVGRSRSRLCRNKQKAQIARAMNLVFTAPLIPSESVGRLRFRLGKNKTLCGGPCHG